MQFDTKIVKTRFQIYAGCSSLGLSSSCAGGVAEVPPALPSEVVPASQVLQ